MRRVAVAAASLGLVAVIAVREASAAEPKGGQKPNPPPAPAAPKATSAIPDRFLKTRPVVKELKVGESGRLWAESVHVAADGAAWLIPLSYVVSDAQVAAPEAYASSVRVTPAAERTFDVDLTGCTAVWALTNSDGSEFVPSTEHVKVRQITCGVEPPTDTMPSRFRGTRLWAVPPGETVFVDARFVGVDLRREAWIDPNCAVRSERSDAAVGAVVAVTTSERDSVKLDLTGVVYHWLPTFFPRVRFFDDEKVLNGHKMTPFGVTSFVKDGATTTKMPQEFVYSSVNVLKAGDGGFVDSHFVAVDPRGGAWLDPEAPVKPAQGKDEWDFKSVGIKSIDRDSCTLDLCGTTFQWCVAGHSGTRFPAELENGNVALGQRWIRVAAISDGEQQFGAVLPETRWGVRIFELAPGDSAYLSSRFLGVDPARHGFVHGSAPLSRAPFADEFGPALGVTIGADGESCTVDLTGVTNWWEMVQAREYALVLKPRPGGPRVNYLKVAKFIVPAVVDAKPPTKKK